MLATYEFTKTLIMECDILGHVIGVVLMQEERPFSLKSYQIKGNNFKKSIYEKEIFSILHLVKQWHPYLIGIYFKVKIDHDSLNHLLEHIYL
jgi:hypothetical protein